MNEVLNKLYKKARSLRDEIGELESDDESIANHLYFAHLQLKVVEDELFNAVQASGGSKDE